MKRNHKWMFSSISIFGFIRNELIIICDLVQFSLCGIGTFGDTKLKGKLLVWSIYSFCQINLMPFE